ncbi:MAG: hypothetical protein U9R56_06585 [candidate division Zixibacteria bacterium]|nr:hypothetical protein [candidate division Zixibacteria bacterium]
METDSGSGTVTIEHYEPDSIVTRLECSGNGILVLSDNYHPDWRVYIDGLEARLLIAYGCFRAVAVPVRSKEVVFVFDPPTTRWGRVLTMMGLSFSIAILIFGVRSNLRKRNTL